jgi:hypothetical protein
MPAQGYRALVAAMASLSESTPSEIRESQTDLLPSCGEAAGLPAYKLLGGKQIAPEW